VYFAINDKDAQVANLLLVANGTDLGSSPKESLDLYEKDRLTADASLRKAAAVLRDDPVAQHQIRLVLDGLGAYEALAAQVILLEQHGTPQLGRPPADALAVFRTATDLMHTTLLPAAQQSSSRRLVPSALTRTPMKAATSSTPSARRSISRPSSTRPSRYSG
jgi:hypothetical protein